MRSFTNGPWLCMWFWKLGRLNILSTFPKFLKIIILQPMAWHTLMYQKHICKRLLICLKKKDNHFSPNEFKKFQQTCIFFIQTKNISHQHFYSITSFISYTHRSYNHKSDLRDNFQQNVLQKKNIGMYILGSNKFPGSHDWFWNSICWRFLVFQSLDIPSQLSTKLFHIRVNWVILIGAACKRIKVRYKGQKISKGNFKSCEKLKNCKF